MKIPSIHLKTMGLLLTCLISSEAFAEVKYRIGYDQTANEYQLFMTPDSAPELDITLSSQVTLTVPHSETQPFSVNTVQSAIPGFRWVQDSRVDAPVEKPNADYVSFSLIPESATPASMGWVAGEELKIFSFKSELGCVNGVDLMANNDPFNHLPNSYSTNPGNSFANLGWLSSNAYIGNYGGAIQCENEGGGSVEPSDPPESSIFTRIEFLEELMIYKQGELDSVSERIREINNDLERVENGGLERRLKNKLRYAHYRESYLLRHLERLEQEQAYLTDYGHDMQEKIASIEAEIKALTIELNEAYSGTRKLSLERRIERLSIKLQRLQRKMEILGKKSVT